MLGRQHGLCVSMENKTSADHGDGGNQGMFNSLLFVAPPLVQRRVDADHTTDLGVWEHEQNELFCHISPRLEVWFNSEEGHACLASKSFLKITNPVELAKAATQYKDQQTELALAKIE